MHDFPDVLILRHGQTEWNAAGRFQGAMDSPLTALGEAQARLQGEILAALAPRLAGWDLRVSPQGRARATAARALASLGREARADDRLREISLGDWEGLTREEVAARFPIEPGDGFWWMDAAPGGEGHPAVAERMRALAAGLTGPAVLISHGIASRHLRAVLMGQPMEAAAALDGVQGVVYRVRGGRETVLRDPAAARV